MDYFYPDRFGYTHPPLALLHLPSLSSASRVQSTWEKMPAWRVAGDFESSYGAMTLESSIAPADSWTTSIGNLLWNELPRNRPHTNRTGARIKAECAKSADCSFQSCLPGGRDHDGPALTCPRPDKCKLCHLHVLAAWTPSEHYYHLLRQRPMESLISQRQVSQDLPPQIWAFYPYFSCLFSFPTSFPAFFLFSPFCLFSFSF